MFHQKVAKFKQETIDSNTEDISIGEITLEDIEKMRQEGETIFNNKKRRVVDVLWEGLNFGT
jgi:hypothetical protein